MRQIDKISLICTPTRTGVGVNLPPQAGFFAESCLVISEM